MGGKPHPVPPNFQRVSFAEGLRSRRVFTGCFWGGVIELENILVD